MRGLQYSFRGNGMFADISCFHMALASFACPSPISVSVGSAVGSEYEAHSRKILCGLLTSPCEHVVSV